MSHGEVLAMLRGSPRHVPVPEDTSLQRRFLSGEADLVLTPEVFLVRQAPHPLARRHPPKYATGLVAGLLRRAGVERLETPSFVALPREGLLCELNVWFAFSARQVSLLVRRPPAKVTEPLIQQGTLPDFTELPRDEPTVRRFEAARDCARCGKPAREYRALGDHLVCKSCGCSFRSTG